MAERVQYDGNPNGFCELCTNQLPKKKTYYLICESKNADGKVQKDEWRCHRNCALVFATKKLDDRHYWTDDVDCYFTPLWAMYEKIDYLKKHRSEFLD